MLKEIEYRGYILNVYASGGVEIDDEEWPFGCQEFDSVQDAQLFIDNNCY